MNRTGKSTQEAEAEMACTFEISPDGGIRTSMDKGEMLALKDMQDAVGGYIECVLFPHGILPDGRVLVMVVNEEGKLIGLPLNPVATFLMRNIVGSADYIAGTAVFASGDAEGDMYSLTEIEEAYLLRILGDIFGYTEM